MDNGNLRQAVKKYRALLSERGMARFEVLALDIDKELIRNLAKHLAVVGPKAVQIREILLANIASTDPKKGGILAALRRSPLVGIDLKLRRERTSGRKVNL